MTPAAVELSPLSQDPTSSPQPLNIAQTPAAVTPAAAEDEDDVWGVGAHPIIGYGPESSWVLGGGAAFYYNSRPKDPNQRLDDYQLNLTYSLKNQASVSINGTKYLRGNKQFLEGSAEFTNTPSSFYGIGPDTPDFAEEEYTRTGLAMTLGFQAMVLPGFYLGPEYDFFYSDINGVEAGSLLANQRISGSGTTHESGIGLLATYDTTNRMLYKLDGMRIELRSSVYHSALGSSNTFGMTSLGVRRYFSLPWRLVLALHTAVRSSYGDVPFFYMQTLGGNKLLRGYSSERHIANHFIGGQAELRFPIFWRFGGVVFAGAAEVEEQWENFGKTPRAAGGLGFRIALNKKQTINLRFDLAYNSDGELKKYIKLGEAF
jgi:hypothetical protein